MATWEIWLSDPSGNRIALLDRTSGFAVTRIRNGIGAAVITIPTDYDKLIAVDYLLEFWRTAEGGGQKLFNVYFIRRWRMSEGADGNEYTTVWAYDGNYLLKSRVVAYASESAEALQTDYMDDMIKAVVTDNLGGDAAAGRDLSAVAGGFTVAADLSAASSKTKAFAWDNVYDVARDISEASRADGTPLYFDVLPSFETSSIAWQFRTYTTRLGADHSTTSDQPVFFGRQWGNLEGGYYEYDHTEELNYVYGRGQGTGEARIGEGVTTADASDTDRINASIWNRREGFCNASSGGGGLTIEAVLSDAQARLEANPPKWRAGGKLLDTPQARYDIDWTFGDTVVLEVRGAQFDTDISAVSFSVDGDGKEDTDIRVEVEGA